MPSLCQMEPRVLTPYEHSVRAAGYGIPSRGPTRLLGNDVGPLSIWTKLDESDSEKLHSSLHQAA